MSWSKNSAAVGANDSLVHVDFMVGEGTTNIVGITKDGREVQIFKDGNWAYVYKGWNQI